MNRNLVKVILSHANHKFSISGIDALGMSFNKKVNQLSWPNELEWIDTFTFNV